MRNHRVIAGIALSAAALLTPAASRAAGIDPQDSSQVERGRYLAVVGDCAACHTLPGSGHDFAGGRPLETPFGTLLGPNITPDPDTGIGAWTDDEFVNALTKGTGRNGMHLYPGMPYTYFTKLSRADALAIRAYLATVPAVRNSVQSNQLPFPFNVRTGLVGWDALFFKPGPFYPVADKSPEWNRGAYLAEGLAHCGLCHTPKNTLGGDKTDEKLQGYALQGWYAPNITNDKRVGLGGWSVDDIAEYLKTGHNRTSAATGLMSEMISLSTSHMTDADLRAIAVYLKDQPGPEPKAPPPADAGVMKMGKSIYADECAACHGGDGKGTPAMFPSINGSPAVQQSDATSLMRVVLRGARSAGTDAAPTAPAMPAFEWLLTDEQVAAVLTYVRNAWGNAAPPVASSDVAKARKDFIERKD
jgi:mono/diheme cytochrome c family protein